MSSANDFINDFIIGSEDHKVAVVTLQNCYLTYCKVKAVNPVPFAELDAAIKKVHTKAEGPTMLLLNRAGMYVYFGIKLDIDGSYGEDYEYDE